MKKLVHGVALLVLTGSIAYAHTELSQSMPADKAVLETAPKEVMLHFSEPVRLTAVSIQKKDGAKQDLGPLPTEAAQHFTMASPGLAEGDYVVSWRSLSEDTHVMTGEFGFTVGAAGAAQPQDQQPTQHSDHSQHPERH